MSFIKSLLNSITEKIYRVLHSTQSATIPPALQSKPAKAIVQNTQTKPSTPAEKTCALQQQQASTCPPFKNKASGAQEMTAKTRRGSTIPIHHKLTKSKNIATRSIATQDIATQDIATQKMRRKYIEESARKNDPDAQCKLGLMYFNGTGIEQNDDMAKYWLENAAHQKLAMGQFNLAGMYYHGRGGAQDYEAAHGLFEKAAQQGLAEAQFHLSGMYAQGMGIEHDSGKALYWLEEAARQGHRDAQLKLLNNHCYSV